MSDDKNQNDERNELFRRYLDGELSGGEEQKVLHMIADDPDMREILQLERSLFQTFSSDPDPESFEVPDRFSDSVMARISASDEEMDSGTAQISTGRSFFQPKLYAIRPVTAAAAAVLLIFSFGFLLADQFSAGQAAEEGQPQIQQIVEHSESEVWIRFVYFDEEAESIAVAGDFSDWEPIDLNREMMGSHQVWTGMVPAQRGEHSYMFVKDGEEWVTDPLAEFQREDGFGNKNAVIYI